MITIEASGNVEIEAKDVDLLYVSQLDASGNATSDSDVLVNAEHLYGSTGVLGQTITDVNGDGFDVLTSALGTWQSNSVDIFYDGNHNAFIDTNDGLNRNATDYDVGNSAVAAGHEQLNWSTQIQSDTGGSATPSFYIVVSGKKVPVYLDNTDTTKPQWKVDTTEFEVLQTPSVKLSREVRLILSLKLWQTIWLLTMVLQSLCPRSKLPRRFT